MADDAHGRGPGPLQRLHDGSRAADRLGLVHPGPRRPDRQVEDRQLDLRQPTAASSGTSTPTRRTSTRSTTSRPTARSPRPRSGDERQLNDGSFNVGVNSGGEYEYKTDANGLHFYILDKRTDAAGHPALQGRRPLARGRGPADARRRAVEPGDGQRRRLRDLHADAQEHGRRRGHPGRRAPDGRRLVLRLATSTACRRPRPAPAGPPTCATRSPPRSSARASRCRSTSRRRPAPRPTARSR